MGAGADRESHQDAKPPSSKGGDKWGTHVLQFYLHRVPRIGQFIDRKGPVWITRDWGREEWGVIILCTQNFCLGYLKVSATAEVIMVQY